jgi:teichuronic acid biosynthesis glycosyltransferase TuaC
MRILFVSSGNHGQLNPLIKAQMESLIQEGMKIDCHLIVGKGLLGYLKNIPMIRKKVKAGRYHLVHAHFSFSAYAASLAFPGRIVVSLMGSDLQDKPWNRWLARFFSRFYWDQVIVKSKGMYSDLKYSKAHIIPNGVNRKRFLPMSKEECQNKLGWNPSQKHLLFAANPKRKEKNYDLVLDAVKILGDKGIELHHLSQVDFSQIPIYMNAADVVLLSSLWEGSPNVIKEALSCNRPIVSTDCGDVRELLAGVKGSYIATYEAADFAKKVLEALHHEDTDGRAHITHLDAAYIAKKIINIYHSTITVNG